MSHSVRGVWVEIHFHAPNLLLSMSHSVRGVWVEIRKDLKPNTLLIVTLRKGCVD